MTDDRIARALAEIDQWRRKFPRTIHYALADVEAILREPEPEPEPPGDEDGEKFVPLAGVNAILASTRSVADGVDTPRAETARDACALISHLVNQLATVDVPLVDYTTDTASHPFEPGDASLCVRCGEHRSWHHD